MSDQNIDVEAQCTTEEKHVADCFVGCRVLFYGYSAYAPISRVPKIKQVIKRILDISRAKARTDKKNSRLTRCSGLIEGKEILGLLVSLALVAAT